MSQSGHVTSLFHLLMSSLIVCYLVLVILLYFVAQVPRSVLSDRTGGAGTPEYRAGHFYIGLDFVYIAQTVYFMQICILYTSRRRLASFCFY